MLTLHVHAALGAVLFQQVSGVMLSHGGLPLGLKKAIVKVNGYNVGSMISTFVKRNTEFPLGFEYFFQ